MNDVADQLKKLIKINRKIINQLHKDEADIDLLRERFDQRGNHTQQLMELTSHFDHSILSSKEKESLKNLFDRFYQQQKKIDKALDYILNESKERLNDAIKTTKAEKSYQALNR